MSDHLRQLAVDWDFYEEQIADPEWRAELQRALVVEMEVEVARLKRLCKTEMDRRRANRRIDLRARRGS